ncbi:uncharacterized protein AB9W97_015385 isoform 2-T2 [Spinachia spinachia]
MTSQVGVNGRGHSGVPLRGPAVPGQTHTSGVAERVTMPVRQKDAQRALELLQQYRANLEQRQRNQSRTAEGHAEEDSQLQQSLDRVINVFQSQLFSALLDIQEYYEFTIRTDSRSSVAQTDGQWNLTATELPAQPLPPSVPPSQQASKEPSKPKPLTPKPKSVKSHAAPLPSERPTSKPSSPRTKGATPPSKQGSVKYRAPLPPVQPAAPKSLAPEPLSSPSDATSPTVTVNGVKTPSGPALNGTKPLHLAATKSNTSSESSFSCTDPKDSLTPTSTTPTTSPGLNRVTDAAAVRTALGTSADAGPGKAARSRSPTSPDKGKFPFSSRSPTGPPHLRLGPVKVTSPSPRHGPASPKPATGPPTPNKVRHLESPQLMAVQFKGDW